MNECDVKYSFEIVACRKLKNRWPKNVCQARKNIQLNWNWTAKIKNADTITKI